MEHTPRTALVTGAAGFIGRRVVKRLAAGGFVVTATDRQAPAAGAGGSPVPEAASFFACDLLDEGEIARVAAGVPAFSAVIHLAALLPGQATRKDLFAVNAGGTSAVLSHFARTGCHVVLLSTGRLYGAQTGPFREDMECRPEDPYDQSKLAAEHVARAWCGARGLALTVLRPSTIYGRGAAGGMLLEGLFEALRAGESFAMTEGAQWRDFLHVDDAVDAIAAVVVRRATGTFNLGSGQKATVRQAAELAARIAGRPDLLRPGALPYRANEVFDYRLDVRALEQATAGWRARVTLTAGLERLWREINER
jgi:nucleoside-diphosphate-sugar epimerase